MTRLAFWHGAGLLTFAGQFRVGQGEPGHGPVAGDDRQQLGTPVPARMRRAVAVARPSEQAKAPRGNHRLPHGMGVASISRSSSADPGVCPTSHRSAASISRAAFFSRSLYSDWPSSRGNRCPTPSGPRAASAAHRHNAAAPAPPPGRLAPPPGRLAPPPGRLARRRSPRAAGGRGTMKAIHPGGHHVFLGALGPADLPWPSGRPGSAGGAAGSPKATSATGPRGQGPGGRHRPRPERSLTEAVPCLGWLRETPVAIAKTLPIRPPAASGAGRTGLA